MFSMLQGLSRGIDAVNEQVGNWVKWFILISVLVSAGNATSRYALGIASNAWLELQWYLFAATYMLCAGYTLKKNEHVRIDLLSSKLRPETRNWIDVFGLVVFIMPVTAYISLQSIPNFIEAFNNNEVSQNAGGLIRWPLRILVPVGFALLFLQSLSELIKRIAFLKGVGEDVLSQGGHATVDMDDAVSDVESK